MDSNGDIAASESSTSKVDLCSCDSVVFKERNGVPGVNYEVDGKASWIPVRERRRGKSRLKPYDKDSDSETEELTLPQYVFSPEMDLLDYILLINTGPILLLKLVVN